MIKRFKTSKKNKTICPTFSTGKKMTTFLSIVDDPYVSIENLGTLSVGSGGIQFRV